MEYQQLDEQSGDITDCSSQWLRDNATHIKSCGCANPAITTTHNGYEHHECLNCDWKWDGPYEVPWATASSDVEPSAFQGNMFQDISQLQDNLQLQGKKLDKVDSLDANPNIMSANRGNKSQECLSCGWSWHDSSDKKLINHTFVPKPVTCYCGNVITDFPPKSYWPKAKCACGKLDTQSM